MPGSGVDATKAGERVFSSRSQRSPSPIFHGDCLQTWRGASSWSIPATTSACGV